ncbi:MAG: response regulator [Lachnospiraceae bacterium]|nr:response regulator [Lachnospiraceae bacterium]
MREWGEKRRCELECSEFTDGEDFLKSGGAYQALFLDIYMKKMNGIDAARVLRKYDRNCKIIFMTISEDHRADEP